ncbi:MAG: methyltransferase domain-containing protein [Acidobacteriota bacterium]
MTSEKFEAFRCAECEALFLDQRLVRDRLKEFYPKHYWWAPGGMSGRLEGIYRGWVLRHDQLAFVKNVLRNYNKPSCLEIGCGSGTFTGMAHNEGIDILGLEISPEAVDEAHSQGIICIETGTVEDTVASGETYDAVILFHVLEHLVDPRQFMENLSRVIREGGSLILQVPNCTSWQARLFGKRWYGLDCPRHVCNYSAGALEYLVTSSGFRISKIETFSLRDNAPAFVSSLLPWLDPLGSRVKNLAAGRTPGELSSFIRNLVYFGLVLCAEPYAWLESLFGRGATLKLSAVRESSGVRE